jgi:hypothetical protein
MAKGVIMITDKVLDGLEHKSDGFLTIQFSDTPSLNAFHPKMEYLFVEITHSQEFIKT